jgi:hypothetical protein
MGANIRLDHASETLAELAREISRVLEELATLTQGSVQ